MEFLGNTAVLGTRSGVYAKLWLGEIVGTADGSGNYLHVVHVVQSDNIYHKAVWLPELKYLQACGLALIDQPLGGSTSDDNKNNYDDNDRSNSNSDDNNDSTNNMYTYSSIRIHIVALPILSSIFQSNTQCVFLFWSCWRQKKWSFCHK